nr:hypothetical protein [Chthoniobacterales bacterium]
MITRNSFCWGARAPRTLATPNAFASRELFPERRILSEVRFGEAPKPAGGAPALPRFAALALVVALSLGAATVAQAQSPSPAAKAAKATQD